MKVLVIYELSPEETKRAIVEMTNEEYTFFSKCHNYMINFDEYDPEKNDSCSVIDNAFCTNEDYRQYCETDKQRAYFGKWVNDLETVDLSDVDKMICTGIYL